MLGVGRFCKAFYLGQVGSHIILSEHCAIKGDMGLLDGGAVENKDILFCCFH